MDDIADLVARLRDDAILGNEHLRRTAADALERLQRERDKAYMREAEMSGKLAACENDAQRYRWLRELKCNQLYLTYNEHACNYVTAKKWIEEFQPEMFADETPENVQAMKDADTIWTLQIYPDTPVGFNVVHSASLDDAIAAMREGKA